MLCRGGGSLWGSTRAWLPLCTDKARNERHTACILIARCTQEPLVNNYAPTSQEEGGNKKIKSTHVVPCLWHRVSLCSYHSDETHWFVRTLSSRYPANIGLEIRTCRNANARPRSTNIRLLLHGDESTILGT
jgi:hypothetical protein